MIPLLQGTAGDYVYGQLSQDVRMSYRLLVQELTCRFRKVEAKRALALRFGRRAQKPNESVQEFAADLMKLYDGAHPQRDRETRTEDLLSDF